MFIHENVFYPELFMHKLYNTGQHFGDSLPEHEPCNETCDTCSRKQQTVGVNSVHVWGSKSQ